MTPAGRDPEDLAFAPITSLAPRIASGELSPVELVQELLLRVERLDPVLGAYVTIDPAVALDDARRREAEIHRDGSRGPLHGIPIAIKDNIAVAAWPTQVGSPLLREHRTAFDAAVVERLRDAGAIVLGKTALHEWAMGGTCIRQPGGPVRNPWDSSRVPGGSSGGSGAAVAAGLAPAALGTDGMGSIRTPAAYCGVVGMKPTQGRVSRWGVLPPTSNPFDHVGPIARTVEDARLLLHAITGADGRDPTSRAAPSDAPPRPDPRRVRIGVVVSPVLDDVRAEVAAAVDDAAQRLAGEGARLEEVRLTTLGLAPSLAPASLTEAQSILHPLAVARRDGFANADIRYRILASAFASADDARRARQLAGVLRAEVESALASVDVLLLPTDPTTAFPIEATEVTVGRGEVVDLGQPGGQARITTRLCLPFNICGLPAISVPAPTLAEGLPVGVQLVGRRWGDDALLDVAALLETAGARVRRPPGLDVIGDEAPRAPAG